MRWRSWPLDLLLSSDIVKTPFDEAAHRGPTHRHGPVGTVAVALWVCVPTAGHNRRFPPPAPTTMRLLSFACGLSALISVAACGQSANPPAAAAPNLGAMT